MSRAHKTLRGSSDDIGWLERTPGVPPVQDGTARFMELLHHIRYLLYQRPFKLCYCNPMNSREKLLHLVLISINCFSCLCCKSISVIFYNNFLLWIYDIVFCIFAMNKLCVYASFNFKGCYKSQSSFQPGLRFKLGSVLVALSISYMNGENIF